MTPRLGTAKYEPNTLADGEPREAPAMPADSCHLEGFALRQKIGLTNDFQQAGERYRSMGKVDQDHLVDNIVDSLGQANKEIGEEDGEEP
jgi:catalase